MKSIILALALSTVSFSAFGQEIVTTDVTEAVEVTETMPDPSVLVDQFTQACTTFKLSEAATAACTANTPPKMTKDATRFRNVGIGAEFNALIRNL